MMLQLVFHECGNEVITVIVAFVPAYFEFDRMLGAGGLEQMGMQFLLEVLIVKPLIDKDFVLRA